MTREEAAKVCQSIKFILDKDDYSDEVEEALNMAIEALEQESIKFYYVESLDDYWVGRRLDNFYYATWHRHFGFIWSHSKYLPWGEHIVDENTLWKEHTYPSEPKEIPFTEWIVGFTKKYFQQEQNCVSGEESRTMTRSEAIKILWQYDVNFEPHPAEDVMHAIDMAIEALEQEQQRQEDIYECQYCFGEVHKNYIYCPFCGKRIEALEQEETLQNFTKPNKSDLISRQDAIDAVGKAMPQLTTPDGCGEFDHDIQITDEAFVDCMQIINGLPSAQPERKTDGDTISRQAAIDALRAMQTYKLGVGEDMLLIDQAEAQTELMLLPSAQPERPKGEWEMCTDDDGIYGVCNRCGMDADFTHYGKSYKYCPNCGADMRGR